MMVTSGDGVVGSVSLDADATAMAFTFQDTDTPADVHVSPVHRFSVQKITDIHHDVPRPVADALLRHGHDVVVLQDALPVTSTDEQVFAPAIAEGRVLITCNRDDFLQLASTREHP